MARISALISLLLLLVLPATAAGAERLAPEYSSSDPADGEELHQAPQTVTITFSEPLQEGDSTIEVTDHCGNRVDDRNVQVSLNEMSVGIAKTPSGHYMVEYRATGLAGITGSSEGRFSFTVHAGKSCSGGGGHGGHGGHMGGQGGGGHNGHGDSDHDMNRHTMHQGGGHSSGTHTGSTHTEGEHSGIAGHNGHDGDGHEDHHAARADQAADIDSNPELAAAQTPFPQLSPDSTAVILALLLCAGFGVLGGWVLRVSGPR